MVGCGILQIFVILGQGSVLGLLDVLLDLGLPGGVHSDLWGHQGGHGHELQVGVTDQLPGQPKERLLEVVVRFSRDVVVLEVLLSVEHDGLGLDFSVLDVDLVTCENNWNVLTDSDKVSVPVGDILVGDPGGDVEHDDGALALDVVAVSQASKLLLSRSIPSIEPDSASVGVKHKWMNLYSKCGDILLLKFSSQMSLDKSGFPSTSISYQDQLESWHIFSSSHCTIIMLLVSCRSESSNI